MSSRHLRNPTLPKLTDTSPIGAWLSVHLLKVAAVVLLLLASLLFLVLQHYGFEINRDGLSRSPNTATAAVDPSKSSQDLS